MSTEYQQALAYEVHTMQNGRIAAFASLQDAQSFATQEAERNATNAQDGAIEVWIENDMEAE